MKIFSRMIIALFIILLMPIGVKAKENRLYFDEIDKKLYYDSSLLDKNIFMNHIDMIPGSSYEDELVINNEEIVAEIVAMMAQCKATVPELVTAKQFDADGLTRCIGNKDRGIDGGVLSIYLFVKEEGFREQLIDCSFTLYYS